MPRAFLITNRRYFNTCNYHKGNAPKYERESPQTDVSPKPEEEVKSLTAVQSENPSSPERDVCTAESCGLLKPSSPQSASFRNESTDWLSAHNTISHHYIHLPILSSYLGIGIDPRSPNVQNLHPKCQECGKRYSTTSNLARHRQIHRSVTDKKARKCPHCDKIYVSTPAYSMHVRTHSQGCHCPFCGKTFSRPWLLQGHIRTHTGEKPFKCHVCGKAFADKSNLRAHIQTHSTNKPYVCQRCGKAFALKSYLYKHEESSCMRICRANQRSAQFRN